MSPIVTIRLSDEEYKALKEMSEKLGYSSVSDYVASLLRGEVKPEKEARKARADDVVAAVERKVQDIVNPYTAKIEELSRRISLVIEKIEELRDAVEKLSKEAPARAAKARGAPERPAASRRRATAMERLKEDKVVFQSELSWLSKPSAFFAKLEREGAVVFKVAGEYVAVSPDFWEEMLSILSKDKTGSAEKVKESMSEKMKKLFSKMLSEGLVVFDPTSKKWEVVVER